MSTTAAPTPHGSGEAVRWSLPTRVVMAFSGVVGFALKILLLGVVNALAVWAGVELAREEKWPALVALVLATVAVDAIFLVPRVPIPLKYLVPGTIFLLAFQIVPIVYTAQLAFTNYSTGHILSKDEAIATIEETSLAAPDGAKSYRLSPAFDRDGALVL